MTQPRPVQWVSSQFSFSNFVAGATTNLLLYNSLSLGFAAVKGATVTRTILKLWVASQALAQLNELAWGITQVNADARAASAFPDPDDMSDRAGWMIRGWELNQMSDLSNSNQWTTVNMDLRGQRVLRNEQDELHLIVHNSGSFGLVWSAFVRVLMKLP